MEKTRGIGREIETYKDYGRSRGLNDKQMQPEQRQATIGSVEKRVGRRIKMFCNTNPNEW